MNDPVGGVHRPPSRLAAYNRAATAVALTLAIVIMLVVLAMIAVTGTAGARLITHQPAPTVCAQAGECV